MRLRAVFSLLLVLCLLFCAVSCTGGGTGGTSAPDTTHSPGTATGGKISLTGSITFSDDTFEYDGTPHSLAVSGDLPEGVTVTYTGNGQTEVGVYTVTAHFTVSEQYLPLEDMTATLTITAKRYTEGPYTYGDEGHTALVRVTPTLAESCLVLPEPVRTLGEEAMLGVLNKKLYIGPGVTEIGPHAVGYLLTEDGYVRNVLLTVYGETGSAAEEYCRRNGIPFVAGGVTRIEGAEDLFVREGLIAHFDGYDAATIDLAAGTWRDKVSGITATLDNVAFWKRREGGGLGYDMTYGQWKQDGSKTGLSLPVSLLSRTAYTVEITVLGFGTQDASGERYYDDAGQYGQYQAGTSAFDFGAYRCLQFLGSTKSTGSSYKTRFFYHPQTWDAHQSGDYYQGDLALFASPVPVNVSFLYQNTGREEGHDYAHAIFAIRKNGASAFTLDNYTTSAKALRTFYPEGEGNFRLLYAFPGTLYQVRVYDRALSRGETARNHVADLARYIGMDFAGTGPLFPEQIEACCQALSGLDYTATKENMQQAWEDAMKESYGATVTVTYRYGDSDKTETVTQQGLLGQRYEIVTPAVSGYIPDKLVVAGNYEQDLSVTVCYHKKPDFMTSGDTLEEFAKRYPGIVCWGDSLTAGAGGNGTTYPKALEELIRKNLLPMSVVNCGVGGETSSTIASRAGAEDYRLYVGEDFTIPADCTPVEIKLAYNYVSGRQGILRQGGGNSVNPVYIGNVKGKLTLSMTPDAPEGAWIATVDEKYLVYTFTREDAGEEVQIQQDEPVFLYGEDAYDGRWCVLYIGCNGGWNNNVEELIRQQQAILEACGCGDRFIILGNHFGSPTDPTQQELDRRMTEKWGDRYIPLRQYFASEEAFRDAGLSDEEIAKYGDDIAAGITSPFFLSDSVHMTGTGYALVARRIYLRMAALGYFDDILADILQSPATEQP